MFTIIREREFDEVIEQLTINHSRMNDLDAAIDWALSRAPNRIPNSVQLMPNYFLWVTDEFYDLEIPIVRILFKIEGNTVILLAISEVEPENEAVFF